MWAALLAALEAIPAIRDLLQKNSDMQLEARLNALEKKHELLVSASMQLVKAQTDKEKDDAILALARARNNT